MQKDGCHSKSQRNTAFTLIELLVVISIMGLICAITFPALTHSKGTARLDAAADTLHAAVKLARQYAISYNQPTYLVLSEGQQNIDHAYRAFAVFTINIHTQPITQDSGVFIQDWALLPAGVVFDHTTGGSSNLFFTSPRAIWNGALSKNNQLLIQQTPYRVHGYKPNGKSGSASHWFFLAEGFYNGEKLIRQSSHGKLIKLTTSGQSQIMDLHLSKTGAPEGLLN